MDFKISVMHIDLLVRDLNAVRENSPLIHNITNYVVMNNTANALLAVGASPVMAHAEEEVEDMVKIASALVINMGTLDPKWTKSMILAGKAANKKGIPLIFDPVGAGATPYRSNVCQEIIQACKPTVIRGNASEIISLNNNNSQTKGVDSTASSDSALDSAKSLALSVGCVVVISGETDYITDSTNVMTVKNGNTMMAKVTGMGCTATAVVGAFCAVNKDALQGALHGMSVMGIAGEIAAMKSRGNGSLQMNFLDELYNLDEDTIRKHIKI